MKKGNRKVLEACERIFLQFDDLAHQGIENGRESLTLQDICWHEVAGDEFIKKYGVDSSYVDFVENLFFLAFGFGFTIGQMVDSTNSQDQEDVKLIQGIIREKELLPYLPREKKAA